MPSDDDFTVELKDHNLQSLMKAFEGKMPVVKVGVLAGKTNRNDKHQGNDNAFIGLIHEFGSPDRNIPARSFLRVPIADHLESYLIDKGANSDDVIKRTIQDKSIIEYMKKVGVTAVEIVHDAFSTAGFGKWKISNMKYKKTKQTLVETRQLERSISFEVK